MTYNKGTFHSECVARIINAPVQQKELHGDGREGKGKHKYNRRRVPHRPPGCVSSEGAELPSQFPPNNEADQYDEDDNDNGSDEALLIHPIIKGEGNKSTFRSTWQAHFGLERHDTRCEGTHRRIIFLSVPDARSIELSADWSYDKS